MRFGILRSQNKRLWYTIEKYGNTFQIVKVYHYKYDAEYEADRLTKEYQYENRTTK